jgi:hypothetical protein
LFASRRFGTDRRTRANAHERPRADAHVQLHDDESSRCRCTPGGREPRGTGGVGGGERGDRVRGLRGRRIPRQGNRTGPPILREGRLIASCGASRGAGQPDRRVNSGPAISGEACSPGSMEMGGPTGPAPPISSYATRCAPDARRVRQDCVFGARRRRQAGHELCLCRRRDDRRRLITHGAAEARRKDQFPKRSVPSAEAIDDEHRKARRGRCCEHRRERLSRGPCADEPRGSEGSPLPAASAMRRSSVTFTFLLLPSARRPAPQGNFCASGGV